MGRVFDATNWSGDDWAAKARVSATTITRFYDLRNRWTKKGANLPTGNTLANFERAAPFTVAKAADAPGFNTIDDNKSVDEDIMLRAIEEVLDLYPRGTARLRSEGHSRTDHPSLPSIHRA